MNRSHRFLTMSLTGIVLMLASCKGTGTSSSTSKPSDTTSSTFPISEATTSEASSQTSETKITSSQKTTAASVTTAEPFTPTVLPKYSFLGTASVSVAAMGASLDLYGGHLINLYEDGTVKVFGGTQAGAMGFSEVTLYGTYVLGAEKTETAYQTRDLTLSLAPEGYTTMTDYKTTLTIEEEDSYFRVSLPTGGANLDDHTDEKNPGVDYHEIPAVEPDKNAKAWYAATAFNVGKMKANYAYFGQFMEDGTFSVTLWWMRIKGVEKGTYSIGKGKKENDGTSSTTEEEVDQLSLTYDILDSKDDDPSSLNPDSVVEKDAKFTFDYIQYPTVVNFSMVCAMHSGDMPVRELPAVAFHLDSSLTQSVK